MFRTGATTLCIVFLVTMRVVRAPDNRCRWSGSSPWRRRGVSTIGSPLTLNEVLSSTGTPVSASNSFSSRYEHRVVLLAHGLHARRAVDMHDRRNPVPPFRPHALGEQHERQILLAFEDLRRALREDDRRERPESLAMLDPVVEDVLHLGLARIGEDAAVAERARPEFGSALKPAEHLLRSAASRCRRRCRRCCLTSVSSRTSASAPPPRRPASLIGRAEIGMVHDEVRGLLQQRRGSRNRRSRWRCRRRPPPAGSTHSRSRRRARAGRWRRSSAPTPPAMHEILRAGGLAQPAARASSSTFSVSSCMRQAMSSQCCIAGLFSQLSPPSILGLVESAVQCGNVQLAVRACSISGLTWPGRPYGARPITSPHLFQSPKM